MHATGLSDEQPRAHFIGSADTSPTTAAAFGAAWVMGCTRTCSAGHPTQAASRPGWTLNAGMRPYDIAFGFAASAARGHPNREDYLTFLGRGPVPAEVDGWVTRFLQGASNEDVVAGFVGSREHFYNPAKGKGTRADWCASAYRDVLPRPVGGRGPYLGRRPEPRLSQESCGLFFGGIKGPGAGPARCGGRRRNTPMMVSSPASSQTRLQRLHESITALPPPE